MAPKNAFLRRLLLAAFAFSGCLFWSGANPTGKRPREFPKEPPILTAKPLQSAPGDDDLTKLLKALYNERLGLAVLHYENLVGGVENNTEALVDSARRLLRAGMEIYQRPQQKIDLLKQMLELSRKADMIMDWIGDPKANKTIAPERRELERRKVREFKLELEIEMLRVKKAADSGPK